MGRGNALFVAGRGAHGPVADPTCARITDAAESAPRAAGITTHRGGTYLAMERPQFSTLAESKMYRTSWGADVIGMTNMPEAKLAREAELDYASIAMITDYDSWHPGHCEVDVTKLIETLMGNADKGRDLVKRLPAPLTSNRAPCPHGRVLSPIHISEPTRPY